MDKDRWYRPFVRAAVLRVLAGGATAVAVLTSITCTASRVGSEKSPDVAAIGSVLRTPLIPLRSPRHTIAFTARPSDAEGPESSARLLTTLERRGWTPVDSDCSGPPPCRPSRPAGQVFVDRDGAYLLVCKVGTDDRTTAAEEGAVGCDQVVSAARAGGAVDGRFAFSLQYPASGVGRWSS